MSKVMMLRKIIALTLLIAISSQLIPAKLLAGNGPAAPEAAQFEPIDTSDLVSIYNGDFSYNIPLLEVPGPEGAWPINLSYHAGVGPNTEATWVGLGWSLNPGAINRFVSGFPDDTWGGLSRSSYWAKGKHGWGVGVGLAWGPVGLSIQYISGKGIVGVNGYVRVLHALGINKTPIDMNVGVGPEGIETSVALTVPLVSSGDLTSSLTLSWSPKNNQGSLSVGVAAVNKQGQGVGLAGVTFSSQQSGASFSAMGLGLSNNSRASEGQFRETTNIVGFPLSYINKFLPDISVAYTEWEWWLSETYYEHAYGTLYHAGYYNEITGILNQVQDIWPDAINVVDKYGLNQEYNAQSINNQPPGLPPIHGSNTPDVHYSVNMDRQLLDEMPFSGEDKYQVNVQGLSGTFKPFLEYGYKLTDSLEEQNGSLAVESGLINTGSHIRFRMENDQGGNFVSLHIGDGYDWNRLDPEQQGSTIIRPAIDKCNGILLGFEITAPDGKIYQFFQPVFSYYEYHENIMLAENGSEEQRASSTFDIPHANTWFITGITGPDYVDQGTAGFTSDDMGFWVKFSYEATPFVFWRTPHTGFHDIHKYVPSTNNKKTSRNHSLGFRDNVYLSSIETPTHVAKFNRSMRSDDLPPTSLNKIEMPVSSWRSGTTTGTSKTVIARINCDKSELSSLSDAVGVGGFTVQVYYKRNVVLGDQVSGGNDYMMPIGYLFSDLQDNDNDGMFEIVVPYWDQNGLYRREAFENDIKSIVLSFFSNDPFQNLPQYSCKLESIDLYKKILLNDGTHRTDYVNTFGANNPKKETINFNYDYSLCPGAPNSIANGKLTLKSISRSGLDGLIALPPTYFTYGSNPSYGREHYDHWNAYTSIGDANQHFCSDLRTEANRDAKAWNLSSVLTPIGAMININYESDEIHVISQEPVSSFLQIALPIEYSPGNQQHFILRDSISRGLFLSVMNMGDNSFHIIKQSSLEDCWWDGIECRCSPPVTGTDVVPISISSIVGETINLANEVLFEESSGGGSCDPTTTYSYYLARPFIFGGGHRVHSIVVDDGTTRKETVFQYRKGTTPLLPNEYHTDKYGGNTELYTLGHKYNALGPAPSVGYQEVRVYDADEQGNPINGLTSFEFYTSFTNPFLVEETADHVRIQDRTGLIGAIKSVSQYRLNGTGFQFPADFQLVAKTSTIYGFSTDLFNEGVSIASPTISEVFSFVSNPSAAPIGTTQQKYKSKYTLRGGSHTYNYSKNVEHIKENVYAVGFHSETYFYESNSQPSGKRVHETKNIVLDAVTGQVVSFPKS